MFFLTRVSLGSNKASHSTSQFNRTGCTVHYVGDPPRLAQRESALRFLSRRHVAAFLLSTSTCSPPLFHHHQRRHHQGTDTTQDVYEDRIGWPIDNSQLSPITLQTWDHWRPALVIDLQLVTPGTVNHHHLKTYIFRATETQRLSFDNSREKETGKLREFSTKSTRNTCGVTRPSPQAEVALGLHRLDADTSRPSTTTIHELSSKRHLIILITKLCSFEQLAVEGVFV